MIGTGGIQVYLLEKICIGCAGGQDFSNSFHISENLTFTSGAYHFSPVHEEIHGTVKTCKSDIPGKEPEWICWGKEPAAFGRG